MKRAVTLITAIAVMTFAATAVVGKNTSGDIGITSGSSSASGTTSVGPNGTEYSAKIEMAGRSSNKTDNQIRNIDFSDHQRVEFEGTITAGTPCHVIDHEINETGDNTYVLNVQTVKDDLDQACAEVVTGINYEGEFEADSGFNLEIQHDGETVETLEDRVVEQEPKSSLIQKILSFLGLQ